MENDFENDWKYEQRNFAITRVSSLPPDNNSYGTINLISTEKVFQKYLDVFSLVSSNRSFSLISFTWFPPIWIANVWITKFLRYKGVALIRQRNELVGQVSRFLSFKSGR